MARRIKQFTFGPGHSGPLPGSYRDGSRAVTVEVRVGSRAGDPAKPRVEKGNTKWTITVPPDHIEEITGLTDEDGAELRLSIASRACEPVTPEPAPTAPDGPDIAAGIAVPEPVPIFGDEPDVEAEE